MIDRIRLLATLIDHFDSAELAILCFRVGIAADMLAGETRQDKARALVEWAERHAQIESLAQTILELKQATPRVRESLLGPQGAEANQSAPYLGLRTFGETDAAYFFGRATLVAELVRRVGAAPLLAVLGPSGSGKSSAVLAGLMPALKNGALPGSECWRYAILKPGARPLDALAATLAQVQGGDVERVRRLRPMLASDKGALLTLADMLRAASADTRLVLVVDQFEELWTQAPTAPDKQRTFVEMERLPFLQLLLAGTVSLDEVARTHSPLVVILTMRADFLHRAAEVPELARALGDHDLIVSPMSRDELREAIEEPATLAGVTLEPGLVPEMLDAVADQPGALPLLSYTLLELWKLRQGGVLTRTAYDALGGVAGALAARADSLLAQHYTGEKRTNLRHLLLRLVQPGEGATDTRRRALLREVVPDGSTPAAVQNLVQPLVEERLLTTGHDDATGEAIIDLSHESLIRAWPTLRRWIDEGRDDLRLHRQLEADTREWQRHQEAPDLLWGALRVASAEAWHERAHPALSTAERRFLDASRAHMESARREREALLEARAEAEEQARAEAESRADAEQRARREAERRVSASRRALTLLVALLVITTMLGGFAWNAADREAMARAEAQRAANRAEDEAQRSQALAFAGEALFELTRGETDRAMSLTAAASRGVAYPYPLLVARALRETMQDSPSLILRGHREPLYIVVWSPDGSQVLTGSADNTARLWEVETGRLLHILAEHSGQVYSAAWSPDGSQVLTGSEDGTARLWEVANGQLRHTLAGHSRAVSAVVWSPDGSQVLTGSADNTARLWEVETGRLLHTLAEHSGQVYSAAWSPDSSQVLTGSADRTARLWDVTSGQTLHTLAEHSGAVYAVAWNSNGRQVLTGSHDHTARLWDVTSGQTLHTLVGHSAEISSVAWSPDGSQVLTGSRDGTARLWRGVSGLLLYTLARHSAEVYGVAWSPDGNQVLTGSMDNTARLWEAETGQLVHTLAGHSGGLRSLAWSPDGSRVLTGSVDGTARLWEVANGRLLHPLEERSGYVNSVAWSPDGSQVLTGSFDNTARLWEVETEQLVHTLAGHSGEVLSVAWSPDGSRVLTGSRDGSARLWDVASGRLLRPLNAYSGYVNSVAWSPDGSKVLTGHADNTARLWEAESGQLVRTLPGHSKDVLSVAWSPDSSQVLTGSEDGTARLWEVTNERLIHSLEGHKGEVFSVAWSPDGSQVLTGSRDGLVRLWEAESGQLLQTLAGDNWAVRGVAWSPDGSRVLAGSDNRTAQMWEVASGQLLDTLVGHRGAIYSVAWSPDGRQVLTGSLDGTARLWVASDRLVAAALIRLTCTNFTDEEIRATVPSWQGSCAALLENVKAEADEYERLLGLHE